MPITIECEYIYWDTQYRWAYTHIYMTYTTILVQLSRLLYRLIHYFSHLQLA